MKKVYYWSPFIDKIATTKAVTERAIVAVAVASATNLQKYY